MGLLVLVLVMVAAILAAVEIFRSGGRALLAWAVEAVALALLIPALAAL